ncbi:DUF6602 domain-containing protein [Francisella adeliensis]|uniref:DUF6602 domain-containing protein n=1 Tax=Francisella adeliensis TaxID=2007306 RepID=A0A2Z4XYI2_9GAMM|nr:DUF6602 domain-containing protein [Francisella adeliensis]AXA33726.1 hypothetical protein CDH04_04555 [Francisella adeliensis]MBK2085622.1 hypothetical protein [Francisella adeliensis]MBK2097500.1 hypothetical protein [Francisella adeliensis]QIW11960.1 hypothetical protein FZC43_04560 [Francisella adeliensis]QIW13836.1 hypothetical protein FZC44_04560 [Francisella adeliensis]
MNNFISQVVNGKINTLKSSYKENKSINHQGVKGNVNEILLRELIQSVIPNKYSFTRGVIHDSKGFQSNETDIIIYDSEILPTILFGSELGFVPAESVKYNIEVKSTLNKTELKSTKNKFDNILKCEGYDGINTLVAFASDLKAKSEIERYYEIDKDNFMKSPLINILMVLDKGYYFFDSKKMYLKDVLDKNTFLKDSTAKEQQIFHIDGNPIKVDPGGILQTEGDLILGQLNYDDIYFYINRWYGLSVESHSYTNECFLGFLSAISNTLSGEKFGKYLLNDIDVEPKIYSECVIDMWGNISYNDVDFSGYSNSKLKESTYSVVLNNKKMGNKIEIFPKNSDS